MKNFQKWVTRTDDDYRSMLPRLIVGLVFLSEGIQKFLFPDSLGAGRFDRIGFDQPELWAGIVGSLEITCGTLVLIGFYARLAAIPLLAIMITAISKTKIPILLEEGFWRMAHESRTDFAMALLTVFILTYGAGRLSVDYYLRRR